MMGWWVIQTDRGFWVEQAKTEPSTAVRGPYETHGEALDAMYAEERGTTRGLAITLALFAAVVLVAGGWLVISWVAGSVR